MKAIYFHTIGAIAVTFGLAACIPASSPPPPAPPPVVTPTPTPLAPSPVPIVQEPVYDRYLDAPQTPGTWSYADDPRETLATYGAGTDFTFIVRCDKSTRQIGLGRVAEARPLVPRAMSISTETVTRQLQARPVGGSLPVVAATLDPRDPLLDAMAITKGRFAVGVEGERTLYIPAWVEVSRVIEDCR